MNQASLLKTLYSQSSFNRTAPLRAVVDKFIDRACLEERLIFQALPSGDMPLVLITQSEVLKNWREILTLILVLRSHGSLQNYRPMLVKAMRDLQRFSLWPEHQLLSLYQQIVAFLLNQSVKEFKLKQYQNGACPLEAKGFAFSAEIPQPFFHAELGVLLCLYAEVKAQGELIEGAVKLAEWQRHTLDHHYHSFVGLFSKEGEASERLLAIHNFLLFNAVAKSANRPDMAFLAQKQLEQLTKMASEELIEIPPYSVILDAFFEELNFPIVSGEYYLPSIVCDEELALAGLRSSESSAIATLYGGVSGMGCYHHKDVQVMSFGPQHLPLGDCSGFGLEGGSRFLNDHIKVFSINTGEYLLEGVSRLSPFIAVGPTEEVPSGRWMESRQKLKHGMLSVEAKFLGLFEPTELIFSFFIKCKDCLIDGGRIIKPRSLNRYHGKSASLKLQGNDSSLLLSAGQNHEEMHIVPLGGGDNFWGADFLVAYQLRDLSGSYCWQLSS